MVNGDSLGNDEQTFERETLKRIFADAFDPDAHKAAETRFRIDQDDLGNETAGLETGRRSRFLNGGSGGLSINGGNGKSGSDRLYETLQWLLLNDAEYARHHAQAMTSLQDAEDKARALLDKIEDELVSAKASLADILENAATLPDGTNVFRDKHGAVRNENGKRVDDADIASIVWRGDEPSYEEYRASADRVEELENAANEVRGIETELGGYRGELTNEDDPATKERVQSITERSDELRARVERIELQIEAGSLSPDADQSRPEAKIEEAEPTSSAVIPTVGLTSKP